MSTMAPGTSIRAPSNIVFTSSNIEMALLWFFTVNPSIRQLFYHIVQHHQDSVAHLNLNASTSLHGSEVFFFQP